MAIATDTGKLSMMEFDLVFEPGLPLSPGTLGTDDQQQLLWGFPEIAWSGVILDPVSDNTKLAHLEWCNLLEAGLPASPGTLGQDDQQQLLWGYPGILWGAAVATVADWLVRARRRGRR